MKSTTILITIGLCTLLVLIPLTPVISMQTHTQSQPVNPLFFTRISRLTTQQQISSYATTYLGKDATITLPIYSRTLITSDLIWHLQNQPPHLQTQQPQLQQKLDTLLTLAPSLLEYLNTYYRENTAEIDQHLTQLQQMTPDELHQYLIEHLTELPIHDLTDLSKTQTPQIQPQNNITSGFICNITSGTLCSITTQPICGLTLQPLCALITMTPPCLTLMGIRCPTTGLKCNPPTTGIFCQLWTKLGPILKSLLLILLATIILFIPVILLVTVLAPQFCTDIQERITIRFNCTEG
ncbi:MAG: hypothetical protein KKC68_07230 [Candidatus Thermoplasmatota archaeon]|nr:hypothetical protein [Candidatus Thermoplasmatota archaeon]MBU1941552.1 hypothetical protein [Candidatus Thermoplasmatota archaeon]